MNQVLYPLVEAKHLLGIRDTATIVRYEAMGLIRIIRANVRRWYVEASEIEIFPARLAEHAKRDWRRSLEEYMGRRA